MHRAEIEYHHNSGGRSGHVLKDLFTAIIVAELLDLTAVWSSGWDKQVLFPAEHVKAVLPTGSESAHVVEIGLSHRIHWDGISFDKFEHLQKMIQKEGDRRSIRFRLSGVHRIHLCQLADWEFQGLIPQGSYERSLAVLRRLYWGEKQPENCGPTAGRTIQKVVIHARRGDVANPSHPEYAKMGPGNWSADFYQKQVTAIKHRFPASSIVMVSERSGSEDLTQIEGIDLCLGGPEKIREHFALMVGADVFMPANSGLSSWAAYLTRGAIMITDKPIKHYGFMKSPDNWVRL
jgi:hypothetical protein